MNRGINILGVGRWITIIIGFLVLVTLAVLATGCAHIRVETPNGSSVQPKWPGRTVSVLNGTTAVLEVRLATGGAACTEVLPQGICPVVVYNYSGRSSRSEILVTGTRDGIPAGIATRSFTVSSNRHDQEIWEVTRLRPLR